MERNLDSLNKIDRQALKYFGDEIFWAVMEARAKSGTPQDQWDYECRAVLRHEQFEDLSAVDRRRLRARYNLDERSKWDLCLYTVSTFLSESDKAERHICRHCHKIYRSRWWATCSSKCLEAIGGDRSCGVCGQSFVLTFHDPTKNPCPNTCTCGQFEQCEDRIALGEFRQDEVQKRG